MATPEQARAAALDALAQIRLGEDPQAEKARQRSSLTISGLIETFIDGHAAKLKAKSAVNYAIALAKLRAAHGAIKAEALTRRKSPQRTKRCQTRLTRPTGCWRRFRACSPGRKLTASCQKAMATRRRKSPDIANKGASGS